MIVLGGKEQTLVRNIYNIIILKSCLPQNSILVMFLVCCEVMMISSNCSLYSVCSKVLTITMEYIPSYILEQPQKFTKTVIPQKYLQIFKSILYSIPILRKSLR